MEYAIVIFTILALLHFWYEGILSPSLRLEIRYRLFELRDEARMLKIRRGNDFQDKHFHYLQDSLNGLIRNLGRIDLAMLTSFIIKLKEDQEFRARMEARSKILDDCKVEEARAIRKKGTNLIERAVSINSAGWLFYIVPIAIALVCYQKTTKAIRFICSMSEHDLEKIAKGPTRGLVG